MPRVSSGTVFEKPIGSGRWYGKFTTSRGRKSVALVTCKSQQEAEQRRDFIAEQLNRLAEGGREEFAGKLLELAAKADVGRLERVQRGVDAIIAGNFEVPRPDDLPDAGPTFQEFAESWTRGDLHRLHPDHVPTKRTVSDDIYRLKSHIYPVVGSTPLREFSAEHAELVMRALPSDLAPASRRHMAQLVHRVLKLAVYPARLIERNPVPAGFLPKPTAIRAQAWLYPEEDARLLARVRVPLMHRLFYGVLAREGLRSSEAGALAWADLDLERGTIVLDSNKTDEARAWALDPSVVRALKKWKEIAPPDPKLGGIVFAESGKTVGVEHLANTFRGHLDGVPGIRAQLFSKGANRSPIRIHDLRATFVTLALATGRTETWVADRTGHKSSAMINRYRRAARTAAELNLGWLSPLDEVIPELAGKVPESSPELPKEPETTRAPLADVEDFDRSRLLALVQTLLGSGTARCGGSIPSSCTTSESLSFSPDGGGSDSSCFSNWPSSWPTLWPNRASSGMASCSATRSPMFTSATLRATSR
jgi:integrase